MSGDLIIAHLVTVFITVSPYEDHWKILRINIKK